MRRAVPLLVLGLALLPGCGSSGGSASADDSDKQGVTLNCLAGKGLDARKDGEEAISVGDPETGPRIVFYLTSGEAEARQFEGDAEGAEQIGSALLFVRDGSDDLLGDVESCLADL